MKHTLIPMITMCALYGATLTSCGDRNSAATSPTETREILVAVSPNLSDKCRKTVWSSLGELVLQGTQPGDVVKVYDGLALNQIASLRIPNEKVMLNNPQARTTRLAKELKSLRAFLEEPKQAVAEDGALLVPQFVELIATQPHKSRRTSILLIGSPVYDYAKDPVWSFADKRYPSDAHLAVDQFRSTFGCKGREQWLTGISVYQFFPNEQVFTIESHRLAVTRFWRRWFRAMGASPGIACGDIKSVMDAVPVDPCKRE